MASTIIADNATYQSHLDQFLAPAVGNDPKWLLCYRASSHGWDVSNFHNRCDGKNHTVTIIKVGVYVFGGYTDIPWGNYNYSVLYWLTLRAQWQLDTRVTFQRVRPFSLSLECSFSSTIIETARSLQKIPPPTPSIETTSYVLENAVHAHHFTCICTVICSLTKWFQCDLYCSNYRKQKYRVYPVHHSCFLKPTRPRL